MLVSVVIPTYNRESTINRALESVFAQTHTDLEVIVVDDGSTDDTEKLLQNTWGDAVRYHYQENQGACVARNTGMSLARGEYIAFLDSDDEWMPEKIETQLAAFEANDDGNLGVVLCNRKVNRKVVSRLRRGGRMPDSTRIALGGFEQFLDVGGVVGRTTSAFLVHRRVFEAGVKFDPSLRSMQDWDYLATVSRKFSVRTVDEVLLINHRGDGGEHIHSGRRLLDGRRRIMEKYRTDLESRPALYARHHKAVARCYYDAGEIEGVRRHLRAAHELQPSTATMFWINLTYLNWWSFKTTLRSIRRVTRTLTTLRLVRMYGPFV